MPLLPYRTILAIGAVVDIAMYSGKEPVTAPDLAHRLQLPRRHLEPLLQALVREGILVGLRGPNGGYRLAKARQATSVFDISEAAKAVEAETPSKQFSGLLGAVVMPTLAQAEQRFASDLARISVEDLVQAATLQMLVSYKPDARSRV
jgi:Rrf2 family transcriptional regulator, iron-sulfur cluster assembly transcription factor